MDRRERIAQLLAQVTSLRAEELDELADLVGQELDDLDGSETTMEVVEATEQMLDAASAVQAERQRRAEQAAELEARRTQARNRLADMERGEDGGGAPAASDTPTEGEEEGTEEEGAEEEGADAEQRVPVTAGAARRLRQMAQRQTPQRRPSPENRGAPARQALVASSEFRTLSPGSLIEDRETLGLGMAEILRGLDRNGPHRKVLVASAHWDYPEEQTLGNDAFENSRKMETALVRGRGRDSSGALVATGGVCLPVNVDYAVPTWATSDRPVRDGLPAFGATRGGLRFVQPPDIGSVWDNTGLASATKVWTEATDAAPGGATKPVYIVACGSEQLVYVNAIPTRLQFGNMQSRFAPEQIAANTDLAVAAAARVAENELLTLIAAAAGHTMTSAQTLGAVRDLLSTLDKTAAAYRWLHRLSRESVTLTIVLPEFLKDMLKEDFAREQAHAYGPGRDPLILSDSDINDLLAERGYNVIWHLDGLPAQTIQTTTVPGQGYAQTAFANNTVVPPWPTSILWHIFVEGTVQFLDGGRLDLGVVRDSTLDSTNDYETFVETFEGVANRGFANGILNVVSALLPTGASSATVPVAVA